MEYVSEALMSLDVFDHIRYRSDRLERYTWHGIESGFVAKSFDREAEHHDRRRAHMIDNHFACVRDKSLGLVDVQNVESSGMEDLMYHFELSIVDHIAFASGNLRQGSLRDVVLGRAKASCCDDYLIACELFRQSVDDFVMVISERYHSGDLHPDVLQST